MSLSTEIASSLSDFFNPKSTAGLLSKLPLGSVTEEIEKITDKAEKIFDAIEKPLTGSTDVNVTGMIINLLIILAGTLVAMSIFKKLRK